ncbi:MAG TPA: hypothetical protein DCG51_08490 [Erysipelotrichaceae bacterium]|nr:hypothetical protein [Erysipelotrichaceae bacterium]
MIIIKEEVIVSRDEPCFNDFEKYFASDNGWKREENTAIVTYRRRKEMSDVIRTGEATND